MGLPAKRRLRRRLRLPLTRTATTRSGNEYRRDRLEAFFQSEDVRRVRQAEGLGTGSRFRQRSPRQRKRICGADGGRMLPVGDSQRVDRLKSAACCWAGCRLVAGFVAGKIHRKNAGNAAISRYFLIFFYLFLSMTTKATKKSKKIRKGKTGGRIFVCRFFGVRCRTSLPQALSGSNSFMEDICL